MSVQAPWAVIPSFFSASPIYPNPALAISATSGTAAAQVSGPRVVTIMSSLPSSPIKTNDVSVYGKIHKEVKELREKKLHSYDILMRIRS